MLPIFHRFLILFIFDRIEKKFSASENKVFNLNNYFIGPFLKNHK